MEEKLGDRIRKAREDYGMSAAKLAERVNITRQHLYMIESGRTADPGALTVAAIAEVLGVTTDALLRGKRTPAQKRPRSRTTAPVG
jgi:transcriptional regulator with XRE-family HTH domain